MKKCGIVFLLSALACGPEDTPGRRVEGELTVATAGNARSATLPSGWQIELDEALVLLGPVYVRPPKRDASLTMRSLLWPSARAHPHAQTLADGEVMGEYLSQFAYDVLGPEMAAGALVSEAGAVDRLSLMLDAPRGADNAARARGYHAYVRGRATRGADRVSFACGLRIDATAEEMPKNLEARRRVDRVAIAASREMDDGAQLRLWVHPERWFDFISFEDFVGSENPCAAENSSFALQWYLGLRRPEAFTAELI